MIVEQQNSDTVLVGREDGTINLKNSFAVSYTFKHRFVLWPSNPKEVIFKLERVEWEKVGQRVWGWRQMTQREGKHVQRSWVRKELSTFKDSWSRRYLMWLVRKWWTWPRVGEPIQPDHRRPYKPNKRVYVLFWFQWELIKRFWADVLNPFKAVFISWSL